LVLIYKGKYNLKFRGQIEHKDGFIVYLKIKHAT